MNFGAIFRSSGSKAFAAVITFLALMFSIAFVPSAAQATDVGLGTSSISGKALLQGLKADSNVYVRLLDSSGSEVASDLNQSDGTYSFESIDAGSYILEFDPQVDGFVTVFSGSVYTVGEATAITVAAAKSSTANNYTLPLAASISGKVLGVASPKNLAQESVQVDVLDKNGSTLWNFETFTDSTGAYTISGLAPGEYHLQFTPSDPNAYLGTFYDGATNFATSKAVNLTAGQKASNINALLLKPSTVSGVVKTASLTGGAASLAEGASVELLNANADTIAIVYTDSSGAYSFASVTPGDYWVRFSPSYDDADHTVAYYKDKTSFETSTKLTVASQTNVTAINATLPAFASISGVVKAGASLGTSKVISGVGVSALDSNGDSVGYASTDSDGKYSITGLDAGSYRIQFTPDAETDPSVVSEFWNHKQTLETATVVNLASGQALTGISPLLPLWSNITGTVKGYVSSSSSVPLENAYVVAYNSAGDSVASASTDASGNYTLDNLGAGTYRLQFVPDSETSGSWLSQYSGNKDSLELATVVTVSASQTVKNQNIVLPRLASLSGIVTGDGNAPLAYTDVTLYDSTGKYISSATTDDSGAYTFDQLSAGAYALYFSPSDQSYTEQYWGHSHSLANAILITVTSGQVLTAQNIKLTKYATISGTVLGFDGSKNVAVANAQVFVYNEAGDFVSNTVSDKDGKWSITSLFGGTYLVSVDGSDSGYLSQWYDKQSASSSATPIVVADGETAALGNIVLKLGGKITGRVTKAAGGAPIAGVYVSVALENGQGASYATTDENGNYTVSGLSSGDYKVYFSSNENYIPLYFGGTRSVDLATKVSVVEQSTTSKIDIALSSGATISGRVTANSAGLADVGVEAQSQDFGSWASTNTDSDGNYTIVGLPAGSYTLHFVPSGNYLESWWGSAGSSNDAQYFTVSASASIKGKDIALVEGATISGSVASAAPGNDAIEFANVDIYKSSGELLKSVSGDEYGNFTVSGLAPDSYKLLFSSSSNFVPVWWNGASSQAKATAITVVSGDEVTGIDAFLSSGATISGTVRGESALAPVALSNVLVYAVNGKGDEIASARSDSAGAYSLSGLAAGSYYLHFVTDLNYISAWSGAADSQVNAKPVSVADAATVSGQDIVLAAGFKISGKVTLAGQPKDQSGIAVYVYDSTGNSVNQAITDENGNYSLQGLPAGTYTLRFESSGMNYVSEWYSNASTIETATTIALTKSSPNFLANENLAAGGSLTGVVNDSNGSPVRVQITALDSSGADAGYAYSDSSGAFKIDGLAAGTYHLYYRANGLNLVSFFSDTAVTVVGGSNTVVSKNPVVLATGAIISGKVLGNSKALANVLVQAIDSSGTYVSSATSAVDGAYSVVGLPAGTYKLLFTPENGSNFIETYSGNASTLETATTITVAAAAQSGSHDINLVTGSSIAGNVSSKIDSSPVVGANVSLCDLSGTQVASTYTDDQGDYKFPGLAPASYKIQIDTPVSQQVGQNFLSGWLSGSSTVSTFASGSTIVLASNTNLTGKNASLALGFTIFGKVTGLRSGISSSLSTAEVNIYSASDNSLVTSRFTDSQGNYYAILPATGSYKVEFVAPDGYLGEFNNNKSTLASADQIKAVSGGVITAVSGELASTGGSLTFTSTPVPTISGNALVGSKLTVNKGNWDAGVNVEIQWWRAGVAIDGANSVDYTLTSDDATSPITVSVTGSKNGYTTVTKTSATVTPLKPTITKFTPASSAPRVKVTITGTNFAGVTAVKLNGVDAAKFTVVSSTTITATFIGKTAKSTIQVVTASGTATSAKKFSLKVAKPTIKSFKKTSGKVGAVVTITGTNLLDTIAVKFGSVAATTVTLVSAKSIRVVVPVGAKSGKITVVSYDGSVKSSKAFKVQ
jgi:protocatechuate 3,4-dioxygenase beta subunit